MLPPFKNVLEFTIDWISVSTEKAFYIPSLPRSQEALEKKSTRPTAESPPRNSFVKPETFWDGLGWLLTAYRSLSLDMAAICIFQYLSAPRSGRKTSSCQQNQPTCHLWLADSTSQAANLPYRRHPFLVLHPLSSDRNLTESVGTFGSNFYSSLLATAGGKGKVVPIPPQRTTTETKGHVVHSKYSFRLLIFYL